MKVGASTFCLEASDKVKAQLLRAGPLPFLTSDARSLRSDLVHIPHAAVAAGHRSALLLFRDIRHERFGSQHQRRDRAGILQGNAHDLGRVEHARLDQVFVVAGQGVVAKVVVLRIVDLSQHDGAFFAGVLGDLAQRLYESALHNVDADLLIALDLQPVECGDAAGQGYTAARDDALFDGCTGGVHSVLDASFLLFHFGLGCGTHLDHCHATDQLRQPLLQLLAVVVAGGLVDLAANFFYAAFDLGVLALAFDHRGVVLVDGDLLGLAKVGHLDVLQLDAEVLGDGLAAGEDGDVLQHGLAAIAEAGRLDGADLQRATQLVDDQGGQRLALDVLSDDQQRLAALGDLLQQRENVLHGADFLFVDEDVGVFLNGFHALGIGDEIGRQVATVELHALDDFELSLERLRLFHGDNPVLANLLHGLGDDLADRFVVVRADGADLGDHVASDGFGELVEFALDAVAFLVQAAANGGDGLLDAALHGHRIGAGCDGLDAFAVDGLSQNGGGGGAIASDVGSLGSDFTHHLRAIVLQPVFQFDFFCHGHAILGNGRRSEFLLNHNIAAFGAESHLHGVVQNINAAENRLPRFLSVYDLLCHNQNLLSEGTDFLAGYACGMSWVAWGSVTSYWRPTPDHYRGAPTVSLLATPDSTPRTSSSFIIRNSSPSILISVPAYLANRMRFPSFTARGNTLPSSLLLPLPTEMTSPSCGLSLALSGMRIPPRVVAASSTRRTRMRSCRGVNFVAILANSLSVSILNRF